MKATAQLVKPQAAADESGVVTALNRKMDAFIGACAKAEKVKGDTYNAGRALLPFQPQAAFDTVYESVKGLESYKGLSAAGKKTLSNYVSLFRQAIARDINYNALTNAELVKSLADAKKAEKAAKEAAETPEEKADKAADESAELIAKAVRLYRENGYDMKALLETVTAEWKAQAIDAAKAGTKADK